MGRIFLGRATGLGGFERKVVIKTLEVPGGAESDPAIAMFLDEARLLGLLHHQHIAGVSEVGCDGDGRYYMVLDYLEGVRAHDVWERAVQLGAALPLDFALTVVSAAANGLHYAHTRQDIDGTPLGIVHRDVTPSNVMIGHDGAVKLIDFGIAMAANRQTKTQTGFVKGKVGYLSPEQVAGGGVDPRTDVFALGILLYELSTLRYAFRDSSDQATMQRIKLGKVVRPSQVAGDYPPELEAIVMKALQVDPRDRFADADAMRRAIEALGHRRHFVLGDAAVIEVMAQLYAAQAPGASQHSPSQVSEPELEWAESDRDLTVRRDPAELLAVMRAEIANVELPPPTPPPVPARPPRAGAPVVMTPKIGANLVRVRTQRRSRLRWMGAIAALGVLGGIGYVVMQESSSAVAGSASPPVSLPIAARTPTVPPSPPEPAPVPAPSLAPPPVPAGVRMRIVTHPAGVTVLLDGKRLGRTPLDETIAADPGTHVIKLRRRGYVTQLLEVELDADVTQDLTLVPQK
jgi:serine/threonine protein kinase